MRIRFGLAYSPLWERSKRITRAYHDVILWILPGTHQDPCMGSSDNHVLTHSYLFVLLFGDNYIVMQRNVIDDTYLEKFVNLVEEHPALYDTSLKEYMHPNWKHL